MDTSGGLGANINEFWEERWKDIVSTDHDYDGDYLIRLMVHKIELIHKYFSNMYLKLEADDKDRPNMTKIIKSLNKCIEIGNKVLSFNYGEDADKIFEEYGNPSWFIESSEEEEYKEWDRLCEESAEARKKDIEKFFRTVGRYIDSWWI